MFCSLFLVVWVIFKIQVTEAKDVSFCVVSRYPFFVECFAVFLMLIWNMLWDITCIYSHSFGYVFGILYFRKIYKVMMK